MLTRLNLTSDTCNTIELNYDCDTLKIFGDEYTGKSNDLVLIFEIESRADCKTIRDLAKCLNELLLDLQVRIGILQRGPDHPVQFTPHGGRRDPVVHIRQEHQYIAH